MKFQIPFSWKIKKNIISMSSAEIILKVVKLISALRVNMISEALSVVGELRFLANRKLFTRYMVLIQKT